MAAGTSVNKNISAEDTAGQSAPRVIGPATGPDAARVLVVLALVLTALSYVNTLRFQFVYDDLPQIISNPRVHSWQHAPRLFVEHVWSQFSGQPGELPATARTAGGSNPYAAVALAYMALRHYVLRGPRVSVAKPWLEVALTLRSFLWF
jgi:hypothetical protein